MALGCPQLPPTEKAVNSMNTLFGYFHYFEGNKVALLLNFEVCTRVVCTYLHVLYPVDSTVGSVSTISCQDFSDVFT